jgi:hypothetical protein
MRSHLFVTKQQTHQLPNVCFSLYDIVPIPMLVDPCHAYCRVQNCKWMLICLGQEINLLMHGNNVCPSTIHVTIVQVCPIQPQLNNRLQAGVVCGYFLPLGHEGFKRRNSPRQYWCALTRHQLLYPVWDLLVNQSQTIISYHPFVTDTQN